MLCSEFPLVGELDQAQIWVVVSTWSIELKLSPSWGSRQGDTFIVSVSHSLSSGSYRDTPEATGVRAATAPEGTRGFRHRHIFTADTYVDVWRASASWIPTQQWMDINLKLPFSAKCLAGLTDLTMRK